jgi:hypothetical protein
MLRSFRAHLLVTVWITLLSFSGADHFARAA